MIRTLVQRCTRRGASFVYYVYILRSQSNPTRIYMGSTSDLKTRLNDHNRGTCQSSKRYVPWTIEWYCAFRPKKRAQEFEHYLKTGSGFAFRNRHLTH